MTNHTNNFFFLFLTRDKLTCSCKLDANAAMAYYDVATRIVTNLKITIDHLRFTVSYQRIHFKFLRIQI